MKKKRSIKYDPGIMQKWIKHLILFSGICAGAVLTKQFCYKKTDGFMLSKIHSSLPFHPEWEIPSLSVHEHADLVKIFDQPFYYLAKGAQSYVFASKDGRYVVKFFRLDHLTPKPWISFLSYPLPLMPFKIQKILSKQQELDKDFQSYKIAFEKMRQETGLLFVHLNKTKSIGKQLVIYDKIGIAHKLDLDEMEFLVQKRATLVYPTIRQFMEAGNTEAAKEGITRLVQLLTGRSQKGIFDKDPDLNTNFGFIGTTPLQIDIGRFRPDENEKTKEIYRDEIIRITDNFRQWLDVHYPPLSEHLMRTIHETL